MSYPADFQTLGAFRNQFDPGFVAVFDDSMVGIPQSHHVPFATYRGEPEKFLIKRYDDLRLGTIGREYRVNCPVHEGTIPLLMYEPEGVIESSRMPVYFHVHGGGFVGGAASMDGPFLRQMVKELNIIIIDVDYRLAPEHPFPTCSDDVWAALQWIIKEASTLRIDISKISIGGVSAGANLATITAIRARDAGIPLLFQFLVVPVTDAAIVDHKTGLVSDSCPYESWKTMGLNPVLSSVRMSWFYDHYLGPFNSPERKARELDWKVSPIRAPNLALLPPTFVAIAEIDILRDEGEAYVAKLREAGVEVYSSRYLGMPHTFLHYGAKLGESHRLQKEILASFKKVLQ